jgi:Family of unknown function (DUF6169)
MQYKFVIERDPQNSYIFETALGIIYDIQFRQFPYLLGDETTEFAKDIFEFVIEILFNPTKKNPPLDKLVSPTIAAIFQDFYHKKSETVCIYICDSFDKRQDIRRKKFDQWFYEYQDSSFSKFDDKFIDSKNNVFPISIIIKKNNPNYAKIALDFANVVLNYNSGK